MTVLSPARPAPPQWRALGTYVDLHVGDPEQESAAITLAQAVLAEVDLACSRFRDDSDLIRANRAAGEWIRVSPVLVGALRAAIWAAEETDGLVDPGLGELLVAAGYDRTFTDLVPSTDPAGMPWADLAPDARRPSWRDIEIDQGRVRIPRGLSVDLGAVGKAYAADLVALSIADRLGTACVVSVGGDVRTAAPGSTDTDGTGHGPRHDSSPVSGLSCDIAIAQDLATLHSGRAPVCLVPLTAGGIATSSITARRWVRGGTTWHHVLDPRSGSPAPEQWRAVTAYGSSAAAANAASTAALVLGADAVPWLDARGIPARLVAADGTVTVTRTWEAARHSGCVVEMKERQ